MLFKKKKKDTMSPDDIKALNKRSLKYVSERDSETYREKKLGDNGAVNIIGDEFVLVCGGKNVMRCDIASVKIGELMNLSGLTVKGFDKDEKREKSVIAYYSDGTVRVNRK